MSRTPDRAVKEIAMGVFIVVLVVAALGWMIWEGVGSLVRWVVG